MAGENPVKSFACPSCQAPVTLRGMGQTSTVACSSCGTVIDSTDENYRIIQRASGQIWQPLIPLGKRGKILDTELEVIGFMERSDATGVYRWDEYLLFNPYEGFFWLMNYNHHWIFLRPVKDSIPISGQGESSWIDYDGQIYKLFLTGIAKVQYVLGEFYWEVKRGDEVVVKDFIAPPRILSLEVADGESVWSAGEHIDSSDITEAFELQNYTASPEGIGAVQPFPAAAWSREVKMTGVLFLVLLVLLHIVCSAGNRATTVYDRYYNYSSLDPVKTVVTDPFEVPRSGNLAVSTQAAVQNNWLSLDMDLVDASGEEIQGGELEVAYYTGIDSDGAWSEGSTRNSILMGGVPAGTYRLSFEPSVGSGISNISYQLSVKNNVPYQGNFWVAFSLVLIPLLALWAWEFSFENRRWQEADP